jgi:hypothetical protein
VRASGAVAEVVAGAGAGDLRDAFMRLAGRAAADEDEVREQAP